MCAQAVARQVWGLCRLVVEEGVELLEPAVGTADRRAWLLLGLSHRDVVAYRLTPWLRMRAIVPFARAAVDLGAPRVVHLKIDTGMSRLGVRPERLREFVDALRRSQGVARRCLHPPRRCGWSRIDGDRGTASPICGGV